ncbi:hypothetical protein DIZ27_38850 [Streptomyces sp. NWU339]|uniref:hypothetical protein n=1 Tax=Streptomyces sp. NWU339 TaxID=2185284 RepID=UPI000D684593|nr:hypothetical protein [Streptomyces sp. NWU339]PWI05494.1 hypothetical protein DIZ27_38850 [Streptomyces sp. NWU339]
MTIEFATRVDQLPDFFEMPCIACEVTGDTGQASSTVSATSGLGLGSCSDHIEVTAQVLRRLRSYDLTGLRASFLTAGIIPEPQHDHGTGEGVVYGRLPGSGARDHSHSAADVMFGRIPLRTARPRPARPVPLDRILYRVRLVWPDAQWVLREPGVRPSLTWRGGPSVEEVAEELRRPDIDMTRTA